MLGLERQRLGEVALEVGGALAGNAVDQVEREVVESRLAQTERHAHVVGLRVPLEHAEQVRVEALRAERHAVHTVSRSSRASSGVTVSGFASTVTSPASGNAASSRSNAAGSVKVGVPPPRKIVSSGRPSASPSSSSSAISAST